MGLWICDLDFRYVVVVQLLSHVWLFATPWTGACGHYFILFICLSRNRFAICSQVQDSVTDSSSIFLVYLLTSAGFWTMFPPYLISRLSARWALSVCRLKPFLCPCSVTECIWFFANPWTIACQAPLSMGFSRQEYSSRLPFPPPGDFPDPGIKPTSPALADRFFTIEHLEGALPQDLPPFLPLSSQSSSELVVWSCWGPFHSLPFPSCVASLALHFTPSCPNNPPWFLILRCLSLISDSGSFHSNLGGTGSYSCGLRLLFWPQSTCCTSKLCFVSGRSRSLRSPAGTLKCKTPTSQHFLRDLISSEISISEILHKERSPWPIIRVPFSLLGIPLWLS